MYEYEIRGVDLSSYDEEYADATIRRIADTLPWSADCVGRIEKLDEEYLVHFEIQAPGRKWAAESHSHDLREALDSIESKVCQYAEQSLQNGSQAA